LNKMMINNYYKRILTTKNEINNKGFTILETMVAALLLSMVVAVMVVATASGFSNVNSLKNTLTATYLSQEGIELVRKVRDDQVINYEDSATRWVEFLGYVDKCLTANGCNIWYNPNVTDVQVSNYAANSFLRYDTGYGYYGYITGDRTTFKRQVIIQVLSATDQEVLVTSTVTWKQGGSDKMFETKEVMFNWF